MKMPPNILPENKQSRLLSPEENLQVFRLLGNRCQSICTTVVQLYFAEPPHPHHSQWVKKNVGVLCFVKDNIRKNYFFRLFCLKLNAIAWEHEMYNNMDYIESTDFMHIFEGEDSIVAFNFASMDEAKDFKRSVDEKVMVRKRREEKRARQSKVPTSSPRIQFEPIDFRKVPDPVAKSAKRKRNITKADIGSPLDFKHISHVGWNPDSGFDIDSEDDQLKFFFEKAGISEKQLQDRDTKEFIYDFINKNGGREAIEKETKNRHSGRRAPAAPPFNNNVVPPIPPRGTTRPHVRTAPPPPPPTMNMNNHVNKSPVVNNYVESEKPIPPPPPPSDFEPPCPPPPPPMSPPPPMEDFHSSPPPPALPSMGSALMESIKSGTTLKPVEERKIAPVEDSRSDLLSDIRKGLKLKPVCEREERKPIVTNTGEPAGSNLAEALARALAERSKAIHSEDDDDDDEDDSNDDWED